MFQLELSTNIPANTMQAEPLVVERKLPFNCILSQVVIGWPNGANNLVGIKVRTGEGEKLFPRDPDSEFVAANGFTGTFPLRETLREGTELEAVLVNNDSSNSHFVNVIPTIVEDMYGESPDISPGDGGER